MTDRAIALLNAQQSKVKERSAPWMVAEISAGKNRIMRN